MVSSFRIDALGLAAAGILVLFGASGCDRARPGSGMQGDAGEESTEESPSARILPEPLVKGSSSGETTGNAGGGEGGEGPIVKKREKPRPFPLAASLDTDPLRRGVGTGFEMEFQLAWPEARRTLRVGQQEVSTWPTMQVQLLREQSDEAARLRVVFQGPVFPLPSGTELRSRADRWGHLVVWPDQRSYRIAPPGSLHALFSDRRVDRTPYVEPKVVTEESGVRLGKETVRRSFDTLLGRVTMEYVAVKELTSAGPLLCKFLLELVRVEQSPALCPDEQLPVHLEVEWSGGRAMNLSVLSWGAVPDLVLDNFRTPPDLPIFKRGELPPSGPYFFEEKERHSVLPITKEKGVPLPPPPPPPPEPTPSQIPPPAVPSQPGPPRNELRLVNSSNRPLVVLMNKTPFVWLGPGETVPVYLGVGEVRLSARSFLGEVVFDEEAHAGPKEVVFGARPAPAPIVRP